MRPVEVADHDLGLAQAEASNDLVAHRLRGGGRERDPHRHLEVIRLRAQPHVVGPEVVPPLADQVRLVDDEEPRLGAAERVERLSVGELLRREEDERVVLGGRGQRGRVLVRGLVRVEHDRFAGPPPGDAPAGRPAARSAARRRSSARAGAARRARRSPTCRHRSAGPRGRRAPRPPPKRPVAVPGEAARTRSGRARARRPARQSHQAVELVAAQLERERGEVLLQVAEREGARDREHRRRARQEPRERDLLGRRAVARGDLGDRAGVDAVEREERDERDPLLGAVVDDLLVRPLREVVAVLDGRDRDDLAPTLDLLDPDLGESDVPDLPALAVGGDRCRDSPRAASRGRRGAGSRGRSPRCAGAAGSPRSARSAPPGCPCRGGSRPSSRRPCRSDAARPLRRSSPRSGRRCRCGPCRPCRSRRRPPAGCARRSPAYS